MYRGVYALQNFVLMVVGLKKSMGDYTETIFSIYKWSGAYNNE